MDPEIALSLPIFCRGSRSGRGAERGLAPIGLSSPEPDSRLMCEVVAAKSLASSDMQLYKEIGEYSWRDFWHGYALADVQPIQMRDFQIFKNAPDSATPNELEAYLDEACGGDRALRAEVEELFQARECTTAVHGCSRSRTDRG